MGEKDPISGSIKMIAFIGGKVPTRGSDKMNASMGGECNTLNYPM